MMIEYTLEETKFLRVFESKMKLNNTLSYPTFLTFIFESVIESEDSKLKEIAELSKEVKIDIWTLFRSKLPSDQISFSHACLLKNPRHFKMITGFGAASDWFENKDELKFFMSMYFGMPKRITEDVDKYVQMIGSLNGVKFPISTLTFRCYQLFFLYLRSSYPCEFKVSDYEAALQILWSSVPDQLLTMADFVKIFKVNNPQSTEVIQWIWEWYCRLVRDVEGTEKCPRSLYHLSRCIIRSKLRENFLLPEGVEELDIPKAVKEYLLLRNFYRMN